MDERKKERKNENVKLPTFVCSDETRSDWIRRLKVIVAFTLQTFY